MIQASPAGPSLDLRKLSSKKSSSSAWKDLFYTFGWILWIAVMIVIASVTFRGIWSAIFGAVPQFLGFSRFWLDTISAPFYSFCMCVVFMIVVDKHDDFSEEIGYSVEFWEFAREYPFESFLVIFAVLNFIASFVWTFVSGLAAYVVLVFVLLVIFLIKKIVCYLMFAIVSAYLQFTGGEREDRDD